MEAYLKRTFAFPAWSRVKSNALWHLFDKYHLGGEAEKLKCSASEVLSLYTLLRHFVETQIGVREELALERASFDAACAIIDITILAKRGVADLSSAAQLLRSAVKDHLDKHIHCYGLGNLKPKHHWMYDVADSMGRDNAVVNRSWT